MRFGAEIASALASPLTHKPAKLIASPGIVPRWIRRMTCSRVMVSETQAFDTGTRLLNSLSPMIQDLTQYRGSVQCAYLKFLHRPYLLLGKESSVNLTHRATRI